MTCLRSGCPLYFCVWGIPASWFPVHIIRGLARVAIRSGGVIIYVASRGRSRLHLLICNLSYRIRANIVLSVGSHLRAVLLCRTRKPKGGS